MHHSKLEAEVKELIESAASVSAQTAQQIIPCGPSKLHALTRAGEIESFLDGGLRRITLRSIIARRERLLAAERPQERETSAA